MSTLPVVLPDDFSPIVEVDEAVTVGQLIAKKPAGKREIINIAQDLSISLEQVKHVLKKNPGDTIEQGDILAEKNGLFGLDKERIISRINGTVISYERDTGNLVVQTEGSDEEESLISPVDGKVILCDNEKIVISTDKNALVGKRGHGTSARGALFFLNEVNAIYFLDSNSAEKIVVGKDITKEIIVKAIGLGAKGIVGTAISDGDFDYLRDRNMTSPVIETDDDIIKKLLDWKEKNVYVEGHTGTIILLEV